jgi:hypothetical protein
VLLSVLLALAVFVVLGVPQPAEAVPAWARKYSVSCTVCHNAWPSLNAYGRDFKTNGYKIPGEADVPEEYNDMIADFLAMDKKFPVAAVLKLRPFDKKKGKQTRIRAGHELELMIGGSINESFSAWVELEAEDEFEDYNILLEQLVGGWNPRSEANVVMGYGPVFWADPYDTLADGGRRMTRNHKGPLSEQGLAGQRLRGNSQWVGGFGRAGTRVFYMAGVSAGNNELEGDDDADFYGRLMFDVTPGVSVGGYLLDGTADAGDSVVWDFKRYGFDVQVELGDFKAYGMYMRLEDTGGDPSDPQDLTQDLGYVEAMYVLHPSGLPMIVPVARLDFLDGRTDLTANLQFYIKQNIKAYIEYWTNLDVPGGSSKDNRIVIQAEMGF